MPLRRSFLLLICVFVFLPPVLRCQDPATKLRLAQSFEQAGDHEQAARLYQGLHESDPRNVVYFEGLRRTLLQLKRYDEAATLIEQRLAASPADIGLRAMLGSVYYRAGKEAEATAEWEHAIATAPASVATYRTVAAVLAENRLLERAIALYRRARGACADPEAFTADLASLLSITMDYSGATTEYVRWLRNNPTQLGFVQGRLATFTGKEEGRTTAVAVLRAELQTGENLLLERLLAWLEVEGKQYGAAMDVYRRIDALSGAHGAELYAFADRVFKEGVFDIAARAYQEAVAVPLASNRMPYARLGYATSLKELGGRADSASLPVTMGLFPVPEAGAGFSGAIDEFTTIIRDYPRSEFSARSYYQIGLIQFERRFDLDAALSSFEQVERELPGAPVLQFDVALRIGVVLMARGDTARAAARFSAVAAAPAALPDQQDEATFRLAEVAYVEGRFPQAIELLNTIALNLKADYANDALLLLAFLQENSTSTPEALAQFAKADFIARQRRNGEAIPLFLAVIKNYPTALLVDDALMKVGVLQTQAGHYAEALASYERLLKEFTQSSIALDRAQFNTAELLQFGLKDRTRAIAAYERLLAEYPGSLLVSLARKRIRDLRGDTM
jgi:tetratricopeptide (TPR) repeat protein